MSEKEQKKDEELGSMSLMEHLTELRNRIGIIFLAFLVLFFLCFIRPFGGILLTLQITSIFGYKHP